MKEKLELTYGTYSEHEILNLLKTQDDYWLPLKLIEFAAQEPDAQSMFEDLRLKADKTTACAVTTYFEEHRRQFVKALKEGLANSAKQKAFEKKNSGKPFVGQILYSCYGYDATIYDYFKVVRVSKKSVWLKAEDTRIFPNIMSRRIKWTKKDHSEYGCRIDDVRFATPWDGIEREDDDYR